MRKVLKFCSKILSDRPFSWLLFILKHRYIPRFSRPRSLNEKINFIKLYNRNPLREAVVDRLFVRNYVGNRVSDCEFPDILWTGEKLDWSVWERLPGKFALKANHGSKMTKIVDKARDNFDEIAYQTEQWLATDYAEVGREWVYKKQSRYLLAESLIIDDGSIPPDYKFLCSAGSVELVQVDLGRFDKHTRNLYTSDFERIQASVEFPAGPSIDKPDAFGKALKIARKLSEDFDLIRVDLYLVGESVYFGELTNTPDNGFGRFNPKGFDFEVGKKFPSKIAY